MTQSRWLFFVLIGVQACVHPGRSAKTSSSKEAAPTPAAAPTLAPAPDALPPKATVLNVDEKEGCTWVRSEGTVMTTDRESPSQARAAAVAEARVTAMQAVLGVEVRSRFIDYQQESLREQKGLTESLLQTTRQGRIVREETLVDEYRDAGGCRRCHYYVQTRSCIMPAQTNTDKDFHVELSLSQDSFIEGSEAKLSVTANRDCFIYVYDVGIDGETSLVVPNDHVGQVSLTKGQAWEYPDAAAERRGVHLVAQLPANRPKVSAETIRVIATKIPLAAQVINPADGGYMDVVRRVHATKTDWEEATQAFTIIRAK